MEEAPIVSAVLFGVLGVAVLVTAIGFLFRSRRVQDLYVRLRESRGPVGLRIPSVATIRFVGACQLLLAMTALSGAAYWLTRI